MTRIRKIEVVEVGPRDGLQNESRPFSTATKIRLIQNLVNAGLRRIEVASFVHPERVPQMADAEEVLSALPKHDTCTYIGLVLNIRGAERAIAAQVGEIGTAVPATTTFGKRNQGQTPAEALEQIKAIIETAKPTRTQVQATVSMAFGCPFEGRVPTDHVVEICCRLADLEITEIGLADTIGVAVPAQVTALFGKVRDVLPHISFRGHFHDTRNTGIANVWAAIEAGVETIDSSIAGLGGCPFAPHATGNVATEDVAYLLRQSGLNNDLDVGALVEIARGVNLELGRPPASGLSRAGDVQCRPSASEISMNATAMA